VSTVAGNGKPGFADGVGGAARFKYPYGIVVDDHGIIYITDYLNHCLRMVVPSDGVAFCVSTMCGSTQDERGRADGIATAARFNGPRGLAMDMDGDLIVADAGNHCIRKVQSTGRVSTVAGSRAGGDAAIGFADGEAEAARFYQPHAVAVDGRSEIFVADQFNHRMRMISGEGACVTTLAGSSESGKIDGEGASARFNMPSVLAIDERGRLLVAVDGDEGCLRVVEASLAPPPHLVVQPTANLAALQDDYGKLLEDRTLADVTFVEDGQRFHGHRCVLAVRSPFFRGLFESGKGMSEGAGGEDIVIEDVSAGAFRILLRFLYTHNLTEAEDCGEGLDVGEMARVADRFQAEKLYERCVWLFKKGLEMKNVMEKLVQVHNLLLLSTQLHTQTYRQT